MDHPGQLDVIEVATLAGDETGILGSLDRGPEDVDCHRFLLGPRPAS
jgi:hypothetical protein